MITVYSEENQPKEGLCTHYAKDIVDGKDVFYWMKQLETDRLYDVAVDLMPCRYTYEATDIKVEEREEPIPPNEQQERFN